MKLTPEKLTAFCAALAETGVVAKACKAVGISRVTAYEWRDEIPEFAEAWGKALKIGITALEDEAHRRAFDGVQEPIFHQGTQVGAVNKYSDTLAIFLLKAHAPEKYRERAGIELTGRNGGPVSFTDAERSVKAAGLLALAQARRQDAGTPKSDDDDDDDISDLV